MKVMIGKLGVGGLWLFILFMLIAGFSKLFNLSAFRDSLDTWVLLPQVARAPVAVLVPTIEVGLSVAWMLLRKKWAYLSLGALVGIFTAIYLVHVLFVEPPQCNCTVRLAAFASWQDTVAGVLIRNIVLFGVWGAGLFKVNSAPEQPTEVDHDSEKHAGVHAH